VVLATASWIGNAPRTQAANASAPSTSKNDAGMVLKGDQEGTAFRSLTVEGEDRVHFEIERPSLDLAIDPSSAPGLDWGSAADVLEKTTPDGVTPYLRGSAATLSPFLGRPWLRLFASGDVARFHPQLENVESWRLLVADSKGQAVVSFEGKGKPPREIAWDGRSANGQPARPGTTYSYVLEARDRAGNKRNFVGQGFELPSYRLQNATGHDLAFVGERGPAAPGGRPSAAGVGHVFEAASWLNQSRVDAPVRVAATARTYEQANALANDVARDLAPLLLGNRTRLQTQVRVESDACPQGMVTIGTTH
jgi:hypothetical protein